MRCARFARDDWLDHGLSELSKHGPEALKLDAICKSAARTKGSFYHHFEDHTAFLVALVERWNTSQTHDLLAALPHDASPEDQSDALNALAMQVDYHLELGIRELARRHEAVVPLVQAADAVRLGALTELYAAQYGVSEAEAETVARLEYACYIGVLLIDPGIDESDQHHLADTFAAMMARFFAKE